MKNIYLFLVFALCLFAAGCSEDSNESPVSAFTIVKNEINLTATGGTGNILLSAAGVEGRCDQEWCRVSVSGTTVAVTADVNPDISGRTALVVLTAGDDVLRVPVTQMGNVIPVADMKEMTLAAKKDEVHVYVKATVPYTAVTDATWLMAAMAGDSLVLSAPDNFVREPRVAKVTLTSGNLSSSIAVTQLGLVLKPELTAAFISNDGGEIRVAVASTLDFTAVSDSPSWLMVEVGDGQVLISAKENVDLALRTAHVTLASHGLEAVITITQRPPMYEDFIGNWTLSGLSSVTKLPMSYDLVVKQKVKGTSYTVNGWSGSGIDGEGFPFVMNYDAETGLVYITAIQSLGVYDKYTVSFVGMIPYETGYSLITGNYMGMIGKLSGNKVSWIGQEVDLGDPEPYIFVGMAYRLKTSSGTFVGYNEDTAFPLNPVMTKASAKAGPKTRSGAGGGALVPAERVIGKK